MQVKAAKLDKEKSEPNSLRTKGCGTQRRFRTYLCELLAPLLKSDLVRAFIVNCQP
jgi:hypothetical protein